MSGRCGFRNTGLWPLVPRALALPSPALLHKANEALRLEVIERRQAEERARASEARYSAFFDNIAEGLFVIDVKPDGQFHYAMINPALAAMTGLDAERIRGLTPAAALPPFSAANAEARFAEAVAAGIPIEY